MDAFDKIKLSFDRIFNTHAIQDGTPPFEFYSESFNKADYGLAVRIEEGLANQTYNLENFILVVFLLLLATTIGIGVAILINQKKIKKQLQQLLEQKKDEP